MASFRYRAATATGSVRSGVLQGASQDEVVWQIRRQGLIPLEAVLTDQSARVATSRRAAPQALANALDELGVLLQAGLTLDRALSVCVDNILDPRVKETFATFHGRVKEGAPLSTAIGEAGRALPPMAEAMCAAGEADGNLGAALSRLAETLDRAYALRQTVVSSLIYPALLVGVATAVILTILLAVVPQFEGLFSGAHAKLPLITRIVMGASEGLRAWGWQILLGLIAAGLVMRWRLRRPGARERFDRSVLAWPYVGRLVVEAQTAAFARTLGALIEGGVALPQSLAIARNTLTNTHMAAAVGKVAAGLREGGGLSGPLAASSVFPPMAISFLRTGEETAQLGRMLIRLADILDRQVRSTIERLIAILTPAITVLMGAVVATVIASLMSAILGFNDLALAP